MRIVLKLTAVLMLLTVTASGVEKNPYVRFSAGKDYFSIARNGIPIPMLVSETDFPGVLP